MRKTALFLFTLYTVAVFADLNVRNYLTVNDVRYNSEQKRDIEWYGGESVQYDIKVVRDGAPVNIPTGTTVRWIAWPTNQIPPTNYFVNTTGTVVNSSNGQVRVVLTPAQANLTTGFYMSQVQLWDDTNYMGLAGSGRIWVRYGPGSESVAYVGTTPAYGDISSVSATNGLAGGGSSGNVTLYLADGWAVTSAYHAGISGTGAVTKSGAQIAVTFPVEADPYAVRTSEVTAVWGGLAATSNANAAAAATAQATGVAAYVRADAAYLLAGQALTTGQTAHTRIDGYVPTITAAVLESDAAWTQTVALAGSAVQTEADTLDSVLLRGRTSTNVPSVGGLVLGDDYRLEEDPGVGFARFTLSDSNKYIICDAGNDGAASGFDADKLDGEHGSYYLSTGTAAATYGTTTRVEQAYALADAAPTWLEGSQTWVEVESDPIWSAASNLYPTWVAGSSAWLEAEANYSAGQSLPAVNAAAATNLTAANIAAGGRFGAIDGSALTNLPPALSVNGLAGITNLVVDDGGAGYATTQGTEQVTVILTNLDAVTLGGLAPASFATATNAFGFWDELGGTNVFRLTDGYTHTLLSFSTNTPRPTAGLAAAYVADIDSPSDFTATNSASDGYALLGNASAGKLYWGQAGSGGGGDCVLVARVALTSDVAQINLDLPSDYENYLVVCKVVCSDPRASTYTYPILSRFNNNNTAVYETQSYYQNNAGGIGAYYNSTGATAIALGEATTTAAYTNNRPAALSVVNLHRRTNAAHQAVGVFWRADNFRERAAHYHEFGTALFAGVVTQLNLMHYQGTNLTTGTEVSLYGYK